MERWRDVPGYEGIYQASDLGNIRTAEGKTTSNARYAIRRWKQRVLKQKVTANRLGRYDARIHLWKDGKAKTWLVARVIGLTWCPGYEDGLTINHKDGNPMNNRADNLEWVTRQENIRHAFRTGLCASFEKETKLISISDKAEYHFASEAEASRFLGRNHNYVNSCVKSGRMARDINGERYHIA